MRRQFYLDLARSGLRMPIGADLILHQQPDPAAVLVDGERLGKVVAAAARQFKTPLAVPRMDLEIEKAAMLHLLGIPAAQIAKYHFEACPTDEALATVETGLAAPPTPQMRAHVEALAYVAQQTDLVPVGMCIGPFSLMTKLVADPITPIFLAGSGLTAAEDEEIRRVEMLLELSTRTILRSLDLQIAAGARAIFVAEPAANKVYLSPKQIDTGADIFARYVMRYNQRLVRKLADAGVDLLFHCCGELTDGMVQQFCALRPAILSLGSSRKLWEDAALVPKDVVLFGNLPSKRFYSDDLISRAEVERQTGELVYRMSETGHPFILGSECDVLSVPGREETILSKVMAFIECDCK